MANEKCQHFRYTLKDSNSCHIVAHDILIWTRSMSTFELNKVCISFNHPPSGLPFTSESPLCTFSDDHHHQVLKLFKTLASIVVFPKLSKTLALASNVVFPKLSNTLASNAVFPKLSKTLASIVVFPKLSKTLALASNVVFPKLSNTLASNAVFPKVSNTLASIVVFPKLSKTLTLASNVVFAKLSRPRKRALYQFCRFLKDTQILQKALAQDHQSFSFWTKLHIPC